MAILCWTRNRRKASSRASARLAAELAGLLPLKGPARRTRDGYNAARRLGPIAAKLRAALEAEARAYREAGGDGVDTFSVSGTLTPRSS